MAKFKFKKNRNSRHFELSAVQDVKVNNQSVFDGEDANINLKTINNQSIIGEGNINIESGTSAYADLPDKPSINDVTLSGNKTSADLGLQPAGNYALKSEIPDVSNFITITVDNLVNYYLKSETYNKTEVNNLISAISTATFELVNELPQTGESNVIYLVPSSNPGTQNVKDEYIWINNAWEQIGSTSVDLTGYATETWVNTQIANFLTQAQIELLINTAISTVNSSITDINSKIPSQASANNQLADKEYVTSAISTVNSSISSINEKIPSTASSSNKLLTLDTLPIYNGGVQ